MAENSKIEWTDATWNVITGCDIESPGCTNCYAMRLAGTRLQHHPSRAGLTKMTKTGPVWTGEVRFNEQWLEQPLKWKAPRKIFVCAHADLFHPKVPVEWIAAIFNVMAKCPQHEFQVLTKRVARARSILAGPKDHSLWSPKLWHRSVLPNVLIGASVEDQKRADERGLDLSEIAAMKWRTWVSYEPALGLVDWGGWEFICWMVSGGESGPRARPTHPDWHRAARDWCEKNEIPFHFKQWGAFGQEGLSSERWLFRPDGTATPDPLPNGIGRHAREGFTVVYRIGKKAAGRLLDGREWNGTPTTPAVR